MMILLQMRLRRLKRLRLRRASKAIAPRPRLKASLSRKSELKLLARHYAEVASEIEYFLMVAESTGSSDGAEWLFAQRRLTRIAKHVGQEEFDAAIGEISVKWKRKFDEAAERKANLEACKRCDRPRTLRDEMYGDGLCSSSGESGSY